jgi:hypothetical protein
MNSKNRLIVFPFSMRSPAEAFARSLYLFEYANYSLAGRPALLVITAFA